MHPARRYPAARPPALCLGSAPAPGGRSAQVPQPRTASLPSSPRAPGVPPALPRGPGVMQAACAGQAAAWEAFPSGGHPPGQEEGWLPGTASRPGTGPARSITPVTTPEGPEEQSRVTWQGSHGPVRAAHAGVCGRVADSCHHVSCVMWIRAQWGRKGPGRSPTRFISVCTIRCRGQIATRNQVGVPRGAPRPLRLSPGSGSAA